MISRENILRKTLYGAGIYAHILRLYYPNETVMKISGRDCGICRNPFADGSPTLHIWIEKLNPETDVSEEMAFHKDATGIVPDGNCFDFARYHYGVAGQQLLNVLNKEMFLHLEDGYSAYNPKVETSSQTAADIERIVFSFFKAPITNSKPNREMTIADAYRYIVSDEARERTERLRSLILSEPKRAKSFKAARFDYCCFSGVFSSRSNSCLIEHSGYLCVDFDHLQNLEAMFKALTNDEYLETQLLFRSPSGDGLKWVIPINICEMSHGDYFRAVEAYIRETYCVSIDRSGKDVARACFLPYDPNAYINPKFSCK